MTCGQKERLGTIFYAVATAVSGTGSLVFGRLFDRFGFVVLVILTLVFHEFRPVARYQCKTLHAGSVIAFLFSSKGNTRNAFRLRMRPAVLSACCFRRFLFAAPASP